MENGAPPQRIYAIQRRLAVPAKFEHVESDRVLRDVMCGGTGFR